MCLPPEGKGKQLLDRSALRSPTLVFLFAAAVTLIGIHARLGPELADDGAFFLRYAENMQSGQFWVWNPGEAPIWGASAPLYPLVLAGLMKVGIPALVTPVVAGMVLTTAAVAGTAAALTRYVGVAAGLVFAVLAALDTGMMYQSGSGLETPLTLLLLAAGVICLLRASPGWLVGIVAGLLIVNKIDLAPFAAFLIAAQWMRAKAFPLHTIGVAAGIAAVWYGFAWLYFGAPLPNAFLTKALHQNDFARSIDWTWFGERVLAVPHLWAVILAAVGLALAWRKPLFVYLLGGTLVHLIAYSLKPPFEPYDWYTMPATFSLCVMAGVGASEITRHKSELAAGVGIAAAVALFSLPTQRFEMAATQRFLAYEEADRADAGRWVNLHTPHDFTVLTVWGNPAYHSHRPVIDGSFLNRAFHDGLGTSPEVVITACQAGALPPDKSAPTACPAEQLQNDEWAANYTSVKVFNKNYSTRTTYYYYVAIVRNDVVRQMKP